MRLFATKNYGKKQIGQGMTEYIIIVALIALAAITGVKFFGTAIQGSFAGMTATLSGGGPADTIGIVTDAADGAAEDAERERDLGSYHE